MRLILPVLMAIALFAQTDSFSESSNAEWHDDGNFGLGYEWVSPSGNGAADKTQDILDQNGTPLYPKKLTFAGTITYRPLRHHLTAILVRVWVVGAGDPMLILNQNLTSEGPAINLEIPQQTWNLPQPVPGLPLQIHVQFNCAGEPGSQDIELELAGQFQ